ncbi:MAG: Peptidyl-tRNA hydrolase ict1, mitochondrial [Marteilia pararefringens]
MSFQYSRSSGPGGQHVNSCDSKVLLRIQLPEMSEFDETSESKEFWISKAMMINLKKKWSHLITKNNQLLLTSQLTRKQIANQADCLKKARDILFLSSKDDNQNKPFVSETDVYTQNLRKIRSNQRRLETKQLRSMKILARKIFI